MSEKNGATLRLRSKSVRRTAGRGIRHNTASTVRRVLIAAVFALFLWGVDSASSRWDIPGMEAHPWVEQFIVMLTKATLQRYKRKLKR